MKIVFSLIILMYYVVSCKATRPVALKEDVAESTLKQCVAVRGNGELIWAHFGGLAKIIEEKGPIDAIAGGSSASITSFLVESMMANPALRRGCEKGVCTEGEAATRLSFMLKSLYYWISVVGDTNEAKALTYIATIKEKLKGINLLSLDSDDVEVVAKGLESLQAILSSDELRLFINPEFLSFILDKDVVLRNPKQSAELIKFRAREAKIAIEQFGAFQASNQQIFFRPGLVNFRGVGQSIGRIADFYAGRFNHAEDAWVQGFNACGTHLAGKLPFEAGAEPCEAAFKLVFQAMRASGHNGKDRALDGVGTYFPAYATTAVLVSNLQGYDQSKQLYLEGQTLPSLFKMADVRFGYTGKELGLKKAQSALANLTDLKSSKFEDLGQMAWIDILAASPAEPGLANAQRLNHPSNYYSLGGWSDLAPILFLKGIGCEEVTYLTRRGEDSKFARDIAGQLGFSSVDQDGIFSLKNSESSLRSSLRAADSVLCSSWNDFKGFSMSGIKSLLNDTYRDSPLLGRDRQNTPLGCGRD